MKCPADGATLLMSERHNVEIDYCPECRGIWLDRGELDKILEQVKHDPAAAPAAMPQADPYAREYRRDDRDQYRDNQYRENQYRDNQRGNSTPKYRKKTSPFELLGDIFGG